MQIEKKMIKQDLLQNDKWPWTAYNYDSQKGPENH